MGENVDFLDRKKNWREEPFKNIVVWNPLEEGPEGLKRQGDE